MTTFEEFEEKARALGADHGKAAASWFFDGDTDDATYRRVLEGIEECDPEIMERIPGSPLSGEWADGMTMGRLLEEIGVADPHAELSFNPDPWDSIADAYCDAYGSAAMDEVARAALLQVERSAEDVSAFVAESWSGIYSTRLQGPHPEGGRVWVTVLLVPDGDKVFTREHRGVLEDVTRRSVVGGGYA